MKRIRNQPDRLPRFDRISIRLVAGRCPSCANEAELGVIYRRSNHSITFRCNHCSLQWTVTLANLHRAAKRKAAHLENSDPNNRITAIIAADPPL
jgi:hypothetical protein